MKYKVGDKLECTFAATQFYTKGSVYTVTKHPTNDSLCVIGSDGYYDNLTTVISEFKKVE